MADLIYRVALAGRERTRAGLAPAFAGRGGPAPQAAAHSLGLINEEETAVGRVHVGLVLLAELPGERPPQGGPELIDLDWLAPDAVRRRPLECWSQLALDLLS